MKKLLLGFAGEMACGKGVATKLVQEWYPETPSFRFSDSLREFYGDLEHCMRHKYRPNVADMSTYYFGGGVSVYGKGNPSIIQFTKWLMSEFIPFHGTWTKVPSTIDLQELSSAVRKYLGGDILERAIIALVNTSSSKSPIIILDGVRRQRDIATLMKVPSISFGLLYLEVDAKTRYARHNARAEKHGDADLTYEQFLKLGSVEAEREIVRMRPLANAIIDNSGELAHLEGALHMLIHAWLTHGTENRR